MTVIYRMTALYRAVIYRFDCSSIKTDCIMITRLLSNYVVWQMIRDKVSLLSSSFRKARAQFNERISGVKDTDPRWRTCTGITNDNMGVPIGSLYIRRFFDQSAIEKVSLSVLLALDVTWFTNSQLKTVFGSNCKILVMPRMC